MKTKQLIERTLKFNRQYVYLEIVRGSIESAQCTACDNCGKLITNMVKVITNDSARERFTIGTDCADTLVKANCMRNNVNSDYQLDIYNYNLCARFATELNKGKFYTPFLDGLVLAVKNDKDKTIQVYTHDFTKYFPHLIK